MLTKHFIVFLCIFRVSYSSDSNNNETLQYILDQLPREGTTCGDKLSAFLSVVKSTGIFCNISESNMLEQSYDLQEDTQGTFYKLDKDMLYKLEEYIGGKIQTDVTKNIPDKIDVAIINHKLYALTKLQTDIDGRIIHETKALAKDTLKKVNAEIERTLFELQNTTISSKLDALNAKIVSLEDSQSSSHRKLQDFEDKMNLKLDALHKQLEKLETAKRYDWDVFNKTLTQILNNNLDKMHKKPGPEKNETELKTTTTRTVLLNQTRGYWDCKKRSIKGYDFKPIRMDSRTFNYVLLNADELGLTYFEINFAVQGTTYAMIQLSPVPNPGIGDGYFVYVMSEAEVNIQKGRSTTSDSIGVSLYEVVKQNRTPGNMSPNAYTAYCMKIRNQTVELYKAGNDSPMLTYSDGRLRTLQYIGFTSWPDSQVTYLYDCPPHFEDTLF